MQSVLEIFFYHKSIVRCPFHMLQSGYTFVAEAHAGDAPLSGGKWRLRLIGSREPLPQLSKETPRNDFSVKELKGYYIPNKKNIICRLALPSYVRLYTVGASIQQYNDPFCMMCFSCQTCG